MSNPTSKPSFRLTAVEEELMMIIWHHGPSTVKQVMDHLPPHHPLAYTSTSTILRILQHKKILSAQKKGRTHVYFPEYTLSDYQNVIIRKAMNSFFSGNASPFIEYLIDHFPISESDREKLIQRITRR